MEKVSIIVPCKEIEDKTIKCIRECLNLDYPDFEVIVLPDFSNKKSKDSRLKIIETGKVKPALKRNIGMKEADGKYFAFIDDDAYPIQDWLKNAIRHFEADLKKRVGIVGGPNLTHPEGNFAERISGYVSSNFWVSGPAHIRYKISKNRFTEELPSCNYVARRGASSDYDECFLTAEDSRFCFICIKKGYKIFYANDVVVYHHRRDSLWKHLKQHYIFGRDIAWLTKKEFSFQKLFYSIMSLFVLGFIGGLLILLVNVFISFNGLIVSGPKDFGLDFLSGVYLLVLSMYFLILIFTSIHENLKVSYYVFITSIGTHFAYGFGYLAGVFSKIEDSAEVSWTSH